MASPAVAASSAADAVRHGTGPADAPIPSNKKSSSRKRAPSAATTRANLYSVIRSKIEPPALRDTTLSRQRLLDRLKEASRRRVTLVVADAGYGKTTLLTDFSSRAYVRCLWYKLDSTDRDWVTLVNYLISSAREVRPQFGEATKRLLTEVAGHESAREKCVATFIAELDELADVPTALILDDVHAVDESSEAWDLLSRLLRDAPKTFRFILASRRRPPLALARIAGMGDLTEITTDDLRFSREETQRLFADSYGQPLDDDVLLELDGRTEGWAASLQLLYSSIRGRPASAARSLARALSGATGPVYDFLAEEVVGRLSPEIVEFLVRGALLDPIRPEHVVALFADGADAPSVEQAAQWIADADHLGILSRGSHRSETRQFHPLLREFLLRQLAERRTVDEIAQMHARVGRVAEQTDTLAACHHYIEARLPQEAMRCLAGSLMLTMGSGRWGAASQLIARLSTEPSEPALLAIQARRLFEEGDTDGAASLLAGTDVASQPAAVRAVLRQTMVSMGWRSGNSGALVATLQEIGQDQETPEIMRDIAQIFVDSSPHSPSPAPFPTLARRLESMAEKQAASGHDFYAAISLHNAAIAHLTSGQFHRALTTAEKALSGFDKLNTAATERHSTHAVMAACAFELGRSQEALEEILAATSSGVEDGDVDAACAFYTATIGDRDEAMRLLLRAERLEREGRSDISGSMFAAFAQALLKLPSDPEAALQLLSRLPSVVPLDLELHLQHRTLTALAELASGRLDAAITTAAEGHAAALRRQGRRFEVRLAVLLALARQDVSALRVAVADAAALGEMALLELADVLGDSLHLTSGVPLEIVRSIEKWPSRWLPVLRRQLQRGNVASAHIAAELLDDHGALEDIVRLRAYDKTYRRRRSGALGRRLARRVSPRLDVRDLGRVSLRVADRTVPLTGIRRKPSSVLMYLITRPKFTATREQVLDELWPENDPTAGSNSLNQSLYFIRREIDPWYEDGFSADYVCFEGEILWLDPALVQAASADFLNESQPSTLHGMSATEMASLAARYVGQFSPEFEYEEWAISWRSRVHAAFLSFTDSALDLLAARREMLTAVEIARHGLSIDPAASDIETKLIWLYWHSGSRSAAAAQYEHLRASHEADGFELRPLPALIASTRPPSSL